MSNICELIKNLKTYEDSDEICEGLLAEADQYKERLNLYPYYMREANVSLIGLWGLANRMAEELEKYDNQQEITNE